MQNTLSKLAGLFIILSLAVFIGLAILVQQKPVVEQRPKLIANDKPLLTYEQKIEGQETGYVSFNDSEGWNVMAWTYFKERHAEYL